MVFLLLLLSINLAFTDCPCIQNWASSDWCSIYSVRANAPEREVTFYIELYTTCANGNDRDDIGAEFFVKDDCHKNVNWGYYPSDYKWGCGVLCGDNCWCGEDCAYAPSFVYSIYTMKVIYGGIFTITVKYKGDILYRNEFDFEEFPGYTGPEILLAIFRSLADETLPEIDVIDIDEGFKIRATARWHPKPENHDQLIEAVIKGEYANDSLVTSLRKTGFDGDITTYETQIAPSALREMYFNPDDHFMNDHKERLTVYTHKAGCDFPENTGPEDRVYIGKYRFWISELTFNNSIDLKKDDPAIPPGQGTQINIQKPEWLMGDARNEPVCYVKNSPVSMKLKAHTNFLPYHKLPFHLSAIPSIDQRRYYIYNDDPSQDTTYYFDNISNCTIDSIKTNGSLPDSVGFDTLSFSWKFRLSPQSNIRSSKRTGTHNIYRIYNDPIQPSHSEVLPVYVEGCLDEVCKDWAKNTNSIDTIFQVCSRGISSFCEYNSMIDSGNDPYSIYWTPNRIGLCLNYSKYMNVLLHSIGVPANCRSIWSGTIQSNIPYLYYWRNASDSSDYYLWVTTNYFSDDYSYIYHAIVNSPQGVADPVTGFYDDWPTYVKKNLRYYYNPLCLPDEPPGPDPQVYDWPYNKYPNIPVPNWNPYRERDSGCYHTPLLLANDERALPKKLESSYITPFRWAKVKSCPDYSKVINIASSQNKRFNDFEHPGMYLARPQAKWVKATEEDQNFIRKVLSENLASEFYSEAIIDSIVSLYLIDLNRKEFYFEATVNSIRFRFSGWYGKFAHIYVFTEIKSKDDFIELSKKYFKLPKLEKEEVVFDDYKDQFGCYDFFYSYDKKDIDFELYGYPYLDCYPSEKNGMECDYDYVIINLTVHADEE